MKNVVKKTCVQCSKTFIITTNDQELYGRMQLPVPTHCSDCRMQRRMATRNERNFYPDMCDSCGDAIISLYSPDKSVTVYCHDCWWSDRWEATEYGRDVDFSRPFFEQFQELQQAVPRANVLKAGGNIINSDYCSYVGDAKNCYLVAGSIYVEDCYYGNPYYSKQCVDSLLIRDCELCYECITSENLYNCAWCQDCFNSRDLLFCYDLRNCSDCIGCVGLRNKQYCIFNKQYTKEAYEQEKLRIDLMDPAKVQRIVKHFERLKLIVPRKYMMGVHNETVNGNYINDSQDCQSCFDSKRCEHVYYSAQVIDLKDCLDNNYTEENELCIDYIGSWKNNRCAYSNTCYQCTEVYYSELCYEGKNLFGCVGLRNQNHAILNKIYSVAEYEALKTKLIEHMRETGEWGEFFPVEQSMFAYNESVADDYFPLTSDDSINRGWAYYNPSASGGTQAQSKQIVQKSAYRIPRDIHQVKDDICLAKLVCAQCQGSYKIIPQELAFYRQQGYPIPRQCPNCRHRNRMSQRPPRALWQRQCMCTQPGHDHGTANSTQQFSRQFSRTFPRQCPREFNTAYAPEKPELVYCEQCYSHEIN